jgi:leukotriene-A4 hydrolase
MATSSVQSTWRAPAPGDIPARDFPETHVDIHTHANLTDFRPGHIDIDWTVDWDKKVLTGTVKHSITIAKDGVDKIVLDTSFLDIKGVTILQSDGQQKKAKFELGKRDGTLGSPLNIELGERRNKGEEVDIVIAYSTTEKCTALGWLAKEQTESGSMPFLYSQAQAIHARAMIPCVDSPSHKITYTSKVKSKYPVLMSALADGSIRASETKFGEARLSQDEDGLGVYRFRQPIGIPSYLIAIVGGNLVFRELAPRVGVWAEPTMIDRAEWEFKEDANRFLIAAEQTISPYSWTRYDCVVLPPSFPYGGMENANLTTLTPTLISGDRSQTDVLLHELGHSWSGNLTSCANWSSFWLNEGINVWIERLLLSIVHGSESGPAIRELHYIIGRKAFEDAVDQFSSVTRFQRLVPVFEKGEDPDDAFSSIPYEKGSLFILYLERLVGGLDNFLPFIRSYFKAFYDRSISTEEWKQHLFDFYAGNEEITKKLNTVEWDEWFHGEGKQLPAEVNFEGALAQQAYKLANRWLDVISGKSTNADFSPKDISGWDPNQIVLFLNELRANKDVTVPAKVANRIDELYNFGTDKNTEIRFNFYVVALQDKESKYAQEAAAWVSKQGRMKYCRPLFRSLFKVDPKLARETFIKNKSFYHPIAAAMIEIVSGNCYCVFYFGVFLITSFYCIFLFSFFRIWVSHHSFSLLHPLFFTCTLSSNCRIKSVNNLFFCRYWDRI